MQQVVPGRHTALAEGEFVVFVIGMRVNKLWKIHRWLPVARSMPAMLRELSLQGDRGLLGFRQMVWGRTITVVQYWRSFDELEAFARNPDDSHLPAWRRYNATIGSGGDVGVFHETYRIEPGRHEAIYVNMPVMGLAAATQHVPVGRRGERARERLAT